MASVTKATSMFHPEMRLNQVFIDNSNSNSNYHKDIDNNRCIISFD